MRREGVAPPQEGKAGAARREEAPAGKSGMVTRKDSSQIRFVSKTIKWLNADLNMNKKRLGEKNIKNHCKLVTK